MSDAARKRQHKAAVPDQRKVLIVDDQPIVRESIVRLLSAEPDLTVVGETDDAHKAMEIIAAASPELLITGLSLHGSHGLDFVKDLHVQYPHVRILVFSAYDEMVHAERAIRAGASGFIRKQESTAELLRAVRKVLSGERHLSERVMVAKVTRHFTPRKDAGGSLIDTLSDRELQVLQLIAQGRSTSQIARALRLDVKTIETYRGRLKVKLGLDSSTSLAQYAAQWLEQAT